MKKLMILTLVVALLVITTGCEKRKEQVSEPPAEVSNTLEESENTDSSLPEVKTVTYDLEKMPESANINAAPVEDLTDLYAVTGTYVWPLTVNGSVWAESWSSPSEIPADQLVYICAFNEWVAYDFSDETVQPFAPAEEVEAAIQKHFDVTVDYLRTANSYNADNNTYPMSEGGGGWAAVAMSAKQEGDQIIIQIGQLPLDETEASEIGILKLEVTDDNIVHYISYECTVENQ